MPKILKHNFSISGSTFIDFLVVLDFLEWQVIFFCSSHPFTIPFRACEWAEAPELERTILAYFSTTLDFAIASRPQPNTIPRGISSMKSVGEGGHETGICFGTYEVFFSSHVRRSPPRRPLENGTPGGSTCGSP